MNADKTMTATFSTFLYSDSGMGLSTGTGSVIGETLAKVVNRLHISNSGETAEAIETAAGEYSVSETLRKLKTATGLSWSKIAELFNVSRRAVYDWLEDKPMADHNYAALRSVYKVIERLDFASPFQLRTFLLFRADSGTSPFQLLKEGRYEEFSKIAHRRTHQDEETKEALLDESVFVSIQDTLSARQDTVHTDLPGKKRSKAARRSSAD